MKKSILTIYIHLRSKVEGRYWNLIVTIVLSAIMSAAGYAGTYMPYIAEVTDEGLAELESEGALIWGRRGELALVLMPHDYGAESESTGQDSALHKMRRKRGIGRIEPGRQALPTLDKARSWFGADAVLSGETFGTPYDGEGVVVGFCDIGFDPTHPVFIDADGGLRVKRFVTYRELYGERREMNGKQDFGKYGTDNEDEFHATHVCGIMAGDYDGPYRGIARGAEIVATTSMLNEVGILAGLEDVIAYAKEHGKRAVVNMSLSRYTGPHDGTSLFCRWLDMAAEDAIICLSSGNAGNTPMSAHITFTESKRSTGMRLHTQDWSNVVVRGAVDMWAPDASPLRARMVIIDDGENKAVATFPWLDSTDRFSWCIDSKTDETFAQYFDGKATLEGGISDLNGRTCVTLDVDAEVKEMVPQGWGKYNIAFEVSGDPETTIWIYADAGTLRLRSWNAINPPSSIGSVSDMCSAQRIISVGMYVNRNSEPLLSGVEKTENVTPLEISVYSSYGTLDDGRVLPHTVGPGHPVVSSMSHYYTDLHLNEVENRVCGKLRQRGSDYYWGDCSGTSMSAPYIAGFVACMLQADPRLQVEDIQDILAMTNRRESADAVAPNQGQGWFDAHEAMSEVLRRTASVGLSETEVNKVRISIAGDRMTVYNPGAAPIQWILTDISGKMLDTGSIRAAVSDIQISLPGGTYILRAGGATAKFIR